MKKLAISTVASSLLFLSISSGVSHAASPNEVTPIKQQTATQESITHLSTDQQNLITKTEKYIEVKSDGTIGFIKGISQSEYKALQLKKLQKHFDYLNEQVALKQITINSDLTIKNESTIRSAVYGEWTYHWWGYDRKFNNSQSESYVRELNSIARSGAVASPLAAALMPIVGAGIAVTAAYYGLLADRVENNNEGSGVYVGITWAIVFDVEPL